MAASHQYLHKSEWSEALLESCEDSNSEDGLVKHPPQRSSKRNAPSWMVILIITLMITNLGWIIAYSFKRISDQQCAKQLTVWSPLNDEIEYAETDFDNPFAHQTIYRGPPTVELESAWEDLWFFEGVRIPEERLSLLNRTIDLGNGRSYRPVEDEEGGYHALFEVFHQLHCLNLVRQYTWRDWYFRHEDIVKPTADLLIGDVSARMHVDHCIEALRISIMCHADTTPYLILMDPTSPIGTRADFSPHHKCRNFERIRKWTDENQLMRPKKRYSNEE